MHNCEYLKNIVISHEVELWLVVMQIREMLISLVLGQERKITDEKIFKKVHVCAT